MKKILNILIIFVSLLISSCAVSEKEGPFELMEKDNFFVDFDLTGATKLDYSERGIVSMSRTGLVEAKKEGNVTLSLGYSDGTTLNKDFVVTKREIKEIDKDQNLKNEKNLKSQIKSMKNKIQSSNYVIIEQILNDEVLTTKMRANPLYIEKTDKKSIKIITKEENQFYEYNKLRDSDYLIKSYYAKDEDEFDIKYEASYYYFDASKTLDYVFDYKKGNIDYINGYYIIRGKYEDCLNEEMRKLIEKEKQNEEVYDLLMNSIVSMYFKFEKDEVIIGATAYVEKGNASVTSTGAYRIRVNSFEPIDLKENVLEEKPSDINGFVPEVEMVDTLYTFASDSFPTECVLTTFEEGQYVIKSENYNAEHMSIYIYDENKNLVQTRFHKSLKETFYIPKDGKYYLKMSKEITGVLSFTISKADFKTTSSLFEPETIKSGEITFEGYMDIHYYEYENTTNSNKTITIRNFGKEPITIIHTPQGYQNEKQYIYEGGKFSFTLTPGKNSFVIYDSNKTYYKNESLTVLIEVTITD